MARVAAAGRLIWAATITLCSLSTAAGQVTLSTREASERRASDFGPAHQGLPAMVRGVVTTRPVRLLQKYIHVGIEQDGHGLVLDAQATDAQFEKLRPGDLVEATGKIGARSGLVVLFVSEFRVLGHQAAPETTAVSLGDAESFRWLGRRISVEGRVVEAGQNDGGAYVLIGDLRKPYKIFVPDSPLSPQPTLGDLLVGDKVRAAGLASQYCRNAPYNQLFQLTVAQQSELVRTDRRSLMPPGVLPTFLIAAAVIGFFWWTRERRLHAQREMLRRAYDLGEGILAASSPQDILKKAAAVLPPVFGTTRLQIYTYNIGTKALDKVGEVPEGEAISVPVEEPRGGTDAGAAACFRNHTLLAVPDTSRSPFPAPDPPGPLMPRSVLFVPMFAQNEVVGVLEMGHDTRTLDFSADKQALAQHLANQAGVALKLLDQRSVREQLFRTEKLAAVGRLITGVVNELQAPLASICNLAEVVQAEVRQQDPGAAEQQLRAIADEARQASEIVTRLVAFASSEPVEARPFDLNNLLRNLAEFREREWKARGIRVRAVMSDDPLEVLGSRGQLEQVFLDLMVRAEQSLTEAAEKLITLRTTRLGRRVLVEISYSGARDGADPFAEAGERKSSTLGLGVCRSVISGHGGELRAIQPPNGDPRFEVEMPWAGREELKPARDAGVRAASQPLTALVMEPDEPVQRHLLGLLSARGYRVVPVQNSDSGLDLAQRMRFDVAFCSVRSPGLNWVELSERMQSRVGGFALMSDGYDPELAADFEGDGRFVLTKPIDEHQLDRVLERVVKPAPKRTAAG